MLKFPDYFLPAIGFILIVIGFALALIPAKIARDKGHNTFWWWMFGLFLFIPALICAILIGPKVSTVVCPKCQHPARSGDRFCQNCGSEL